jgi:YegS/Rv2252/BmrU family lipid kinase
MKKGFLIFNSSAGTRPKSAFLIRQVLEQFAAQQIDVTPSPTEPDGSVILQVRELVRDRPDLLVAWGGDGTIHEVVNGMFGSGIPLGILPGGTANLTVRELSLPGNVPDAIRLIGAGHLKQVSIGQANSRYFILMAGVGFDSEVIRNVRWDLKKKLGKMAFGIAAIEAARRYAYPTFKIHADNVSKEAVFAVICNARHYAAYFVLTPDADICDDFLYVCLFKDPGLVNMFRYALHAFRGTHQKLSSVEIIKTRELEIEGPDDVVVQADGELIGGLPKRFSIHPRSFPIYCRPV